MLDIGCGAGEPIARHLIEQGCVEFSPAILSIARRRFPDARWIEADMRNLDLGERFAGIVAWDSFFHLSKDEQREMIPRLARHLLPGGALLVTVGPDDGKPVGRVGDGAVFHASASPGEYADRLSAVGLEIESFVAYDPDCGGHSVILAIRR